MRQETKWRLEDGVEREGRRGRRKRERPNEARAPRRTGFFRRIPFPCALFRPSSRRPRDRMNNLSVFTGLGRAGPGGRRTPWAPLDFLWPSLLRGLWPPSCSRVIPCAVVGLHDRVVGVFVRVPIAPARPPGVVAFGVPCGGPWIRVDSHSIRC